ncbi:hypothetical protein BJ546DRAFT_897082, partial [Cryomyces antarcticus]
MSSTSLLRDPYMTPAHPDGGVGVSTNPAHRIRIRHPGYEDRNNVIMVLQAPDVPGGGIDYGTARIGCAIVANNRWDGFLTASRNGPEIDTVRNEVLPCGDYYFSVPQTENGKQQFSPLFSDWSFPHNDLPENWRSVQIKEHTRSSSVVSTVVKIRDTACRLTGCTEGVELAHVCPQSVNDWFHKNRMDDYILSPRRSGSSAIDDASNVMLLRSDIHKAFDAVKIALVPKASSSGSYVMVAHILELSPELVALYHNVPLQPLKGLSVEFLFARFAWSMFSFVEGFLQARTERVLCVSIRDARPVIRDFSGDECLSFTRSKPSRSQSPKKRERSDADADADADAGVDEDCNSSFREHKRRRS